MIQSATCFSLPTSVVLDRGLEPVSSPVRHLGHAVRIDAAGGVLRASGRPVDLDRHRPSSHVFRKTCATSLDEAGLSARAIADQLEHPRPSMTPDVYMARKVLNPATAAALQAAAGSGKEATADA